MFTAQGHSPQKLQTEQRAAEKTTPGEGTSRGTEKHIQHEVSEMSTDFFFTHAKKSEIQRKISFNG